MVDVDSFKLYNDRNGHEAGNDALARMAQLLEQSVRDTDIAARYGGEEFALILPETSKTGAFQVADRARESIADCAFPFREGQPGERLTVSMGVATYPADARDVRTLLERADSALYVAKARGKNQVYLYGHDRRSFRRIPTILDGQYCVLAAEYHAMQTINISERGLLLRVDRQLPLGSLIDLKLSVSEAEEPIVASGRVVRVEQSEVNGFAAAIRVVEIAPGDRQRLSECISEMESPFGVTEPALQGSA
jgi:diguanylate cyclase (GGDEF)-like protein